MSASTEKTPHPVTLDTFTRLSPSTYLLSPPKTHSHPPTSTFPPTTIILCTWMAAAPRHIAKYLTPYTTLFPTSRILLITCSVYDMATPDRTRLAAAVSAIRADPKCALLAHTFSNGGAIQLCKLATAFREEAGAALPIRALILDSAPARKTDKRAATALVYSFPKGLLRWVSGRVVTNALAWMWWVLKTVLRMKDVIKRVGRELVEPGLIPREAPRCYIYSETDQMVWWEDVEAHASKVEETGCRVVREKFEGSAHVGHAIVDDERYWQVVKRHWESTKS